MGSKQTSAGDAAEELLVILHQGLERIVVLDLVVSFLPNVTRHEGEF
jgi:hypothetical protein